MTNQKSILCQRAVDGDAQALNELSKLAIAGNAQSQLELGSMYYHGEGVERDCTEAVKWFRLAAGQGDAQAQFALGTAYSNGEGVQKNLFEAVKWCRMAAEQEHHEAELYVGEYCEQHLDEPQAAMWYERAAKHGNAVAVYYLGCYRKEGRGGLTSDLEQAETYFRQCAHAAGYRKAAYELYECRKARVENGECEDMDDALDWLIDSAMNGGYAPAQYEAGRLLIEESNEMDGLEWLLRAAEQGHEEAQRAIFTYYLNCGITAENGVTHICASKEGLKRIKESAKNKLPFALALLADYYGKTEDYASAAKYLKRGVKADNVGVCLWFSGKFFENNYGGLFPWYEESSNICSRQSRASNFYACSVMAGYEPALDDLIRCFLNEQEAEFTPEARAEVEVTYGSESMMLRYCDCVAQFFYVLPEL